MFARGEDGVYRCEDFVSYGWLEHGFGTRNSGDWLDGRKIAELKQVHSAEIEIVGGNWGILGEGDGLIGRDAGVLLAIRTADCLPVLMVDVRLKVVAAVHAGWRGIVAGIGGRAVERMGEAFGSRAEDLRVAIGPGIGECCFETGPEVARQFFPEKKFGNEKPHVNLGEAMFGQLCETGIPAEGIFRAKLCTKCLGGEFYSYRREGQRAGRMWSAVGVREEAEKGRLARNQPPGIPGRSLKKETAD